MESVEIKRLDYLMLIFIVGVLILLFTLLIYNRVTPKQTEEVEEEEVVEGYDNKKQLAEKVEQNITETVEEVNEEPDAADPDMFCFGDYCSKTSTKEGFSIRETVSTALKNRF